MDRQQLSHLLILQQVVEEGSFRAAARRLNVAPSAVSYAVKQLEESLGVQLLHRTTRSIGLSEAGKVLIRQTASALRMIEDGFVEARTTRYAVSGVLRINMAYSAARFLIMPFLGDFTQTYPEIILDLAINNRFVDIVSGGFDAGIRVHEHVERDMIAAKIGGQLRSVLVGTPQYFARNPAPAHPRDLARHKGILYRFDEKLPYIWEFEKGTKKLTVIPPERLVVNHNEMVIEAALQHIGLAYVFENYVAEHLQAGRLQQVMQDWSPAYPGFHIYYPQQKMRPALRAFIDFFTDKNRKADRL